MRDIAVDTVFIGSCTNSRIEDLRAAAVVARGRRYVTACALVVPGSMKVKAEAEAEGLHEVFLAAGFDWREAGCSMCLAMNPDKLEAGERCADVEPQLRGPSGQGRADAPRLARGGRRHRDRRALRHARRPELSREDEPWSPSRDHRPGRAPRPGRRRHRPDHPE